MPAQLDKNKPTSLIFHGANFVGAKLAELLYSQKSNIFLIDEFSKANRDVMKKLKKDFQVTSFDISGVTSFDSDIKRIDYIFILLDQFLSTNTSISSPKFVSETNSIDTIMKAGLRHGAKVILTTTISLHRKLLSLSSKDTTKLSEIKQGETFTSAELQRYCENLAAEYHDQAGLDIRIARLGEVMGENMPTDAHTPLVSLLKDAVTKPKLTIYGEGLDYKYYVHVLDAVYGIIKALFSNRTNGEVYSLSYNEEISTLNLAYKLLEMNPQANEIAFVESEESEGPQQMYVPAKNLSKLGWKPKISIDKALLETLQYFYDSYKAKWTNKPAQEKGRRVTAKQHPSEAMSFLGKVLQVVFFPIIVPYKFLRSLYQKISQLRLSATGIAKFFLIALPVVALYLAIIQPLIQITVGGGLAYAFSRIAYSQVEQLNTKGAQNSMKVARFFSGAMSDGVKALRWVAYIPAAEDFYSQNVQLASGVDHLTNGAYYLVQGIDPYVEYFKTFEPLTSFNASPTGGSKTYQKQLKAMEDGVPFTDRATVEITLATEALEAVDIGSYPQFTREPLRQLVDKSKLLKSQVTTLQGVASFLPDLLGKSGRKNYVILLQNPMELRSTGGWLTSYALIGLEYGQVRTLKVDDVYNADGQLKTTVLPPKSMRQALGLNSWTLSTSNWSPDFAQAAEAAEYFLKLEEKAVTIDGVVAIDLEYIRRLIDVWGSIEVVGEDNPVTKDNLYNKVVQLHQSFSPGSTQKPEFLSNLANALLQKILGSTRDKWPRIAEITGESMEEKHILVYMHNTYLAQFLESLKWTGTMPSSANLIFPIEWNKGGNKANHFLERSSLVETSITNESQIVQKLTITYTNLSTKNSYPEGAYSAYVRIFLPRGIEMLRIEGLAKNSFYNKAEFGLSMVAGDLNVPIKSSRTISILYRLDREKMTDFPLITAPGDKLQYTVNYTKQPGLISDNISFEVSYPSGWEPTNLENIQRELNKLVFRTELSTDKQFTVEWQKAK